MNHKKKILLIGFIFMVVFTPYPQQVSDINQAAPIKLTVQAATNPIMQEYYVSPSGFDSDSGNQTHPFLTIEKAQNMTRLNISQGMTGDVIVNLAGGEYYLDSPYSFL